MFRSAKTGLAVIALLSLSAACSSSSAGDDSEDNLFSITGAARKLNFTSTVYVEPGASDYQIYGAIKRMNQSAFGALRTAEIGVNTRELAPQGPEGQGPVAFVRDPDRVKRETVRVVDPNVPNDPGREMLRVTYTYVDDALIPDNMPEDRRIRSSVPAAVLNGNYQAVAQRVLRECTENSQHDRDFESAIWYVFNPSLSQCQTAMKAEQERIDADRARTSSSDGLRVPQSEVDRLYVPITVQLSPSEEGNGKQRPEYDRLYAGGVKPGRLVIAMVNGKMADWAAGEHKESIDDDGYAMYFGGLQEIFRTRKMKFVGTEPAEDLTKLDVNGTTLDVPGGFDTIYQWETLKTGFPQGVDRRAVRVAAGNKLAKHWIKFEAPVTVKVGGEAEKQVVIELDTFLEAESDDAPHKRAMKEADVVIYNGHSYIGYGPLDPSRFRHGDLPQSYQLLFINGCVSYNYYEKDYFALKDRKTKDLDIITNGLESWVNGSGEAMGRFVARLIDGKQATYEELLKASQFDNFWQAYPWGEDALRVVDGELDNEYESDAKPIVVR